MARQHFPIRFGYLRSLFSLLGCGPSRSEVVLEHGELLVRMGWMFSMRMPVDSVRRAKHGEARWWLGIGVHGLFGLWQINGALGSVVTLELEPPVRAKLLSVVPVKVRRLHVSVEDPDAVIAAVER